MKMPGLELPPFEVPKLGLAFFRRRLFFRAVFVLLIAATLALALAVLQDEKERSYQSYQNSFKKTQSEMVARLRHPAGQLALLNPQHSTTPANALSPVLLPFGALDFDDPFKAQQAIDSAACSVRYESGSSACAAVGNNPIAGGFVYLAGSFNSPALIGRERGQLDLLGISRMRVSLAMRGQTTIWIAPLEWQERDSLGAGQALVGRWAGFAVADVLPDESALIRESRPVREFRAWLWQSSACAQADSTAPDCPRRAFFSIRLPAEALREAIWRKPQVVWPPADLHEMRVSLQVRSGSDVLFDTASPRLPEPSALEEISQSLLPGETLHIQRISGRQAASAPVIRLRNQADAQEQVSPWVRRIVSLLPVDTQVPPLKAVSQINTAVGNFEATFTGDVRAVERSISIVATRMLWLVGAMLAAIGIAWLFIEIGLIRRVTQLAKRAAAVSYNVNAPELENRLAAMDVRDLRGNDELGILAGGLSDLMERVKGDISREHLRAQQEQQMWHAVGHEIMSPLQSLMVLHGKESDPSYRYVQRMQQAVKILYGQASPSEAIAAAHMAADHLALDEFLAEIAANAAFAGIEQVHYTRDARMAGLHVQADAFALEDVITHILNNAQQHRHPGSPITLSLELTPTHAVVSIHNQGAAIPADLLPTIFDYGVSASKTDAHDASHRGQGLFVAKTYMAKMGGTVQALNVTDGVVFRLSLPRASQ
jgi:two-component system, OmpR family, sensor kinase